MKLETLNLETKRLILRKALPSDAESIFKNFSSDPEVCKYLTWSPHENIGATKLFIELAEDLAYAKNMIIWSCEEKTSAEIIGLVSLKRISRFRRIAEVGFCFGRAFWHQGFAREALEKVLDYAFSKTYKKIIAKTLKENTASIEFLKKAGMKYQRTEKKLWPKDNTTKELYVYSLKKN